MNPIQFKSRVEYWNNLTSTTRFTFSEYNASGTLAQDKYINQEMGDEEQRQPTNFQWIQRIRDNLATLLKTSTPTITNGTVVTNRYFSATPSNLTLPADYRSFVLLMCTIDGYTDYARPISFNELGPMLRDSFRHPQNSKFYFNEKDGQNFTLWRGVGGTFSAATLTYIKQPANFSIGFESQVVSAGSALTNLLVYYALEISVYSGVTYQVGDTITGSGALLSSGSAILVSNTSDLSTPAFTHEEIARIASRTMLESVGEFQESQAINSETQQPN